MEASLNSNFPAYGLRTGFITDQIAALLGGFYILFGLAGLLFSPRQTN